MKEIMKLGFILFLISAIAAASLGYVNAVTQGPIEESKRLAEIEMRKTLLSEATDFEKIEIEAPQDYPLIAEVYKALNNGDICGYTFKTIPKGYAGEVEVLVGIDAKGVIAGIGIGNQKETPGLGTKAKDDAFKGQYIGKSTMLSVIKSGTPKEDEISAISGATITSRAVTNGVNEALKYYQEKLSKGN